MQNQTGFIHSIETAGMVDGPGIRYTIFFQGCLLRCLYCHNPDTWQANRGQQMSVSEIVSDVLKYKNFLKYSGGGVTLTGGEPLMQSEFLLELLNALKAEGLHTALDTSGYAPVEKVQPILENVDLLMLDIKSINPATFLKVSGVEIAPTLKTLNLANEMGVKTWIRFVLVPGLTDNEQDFHEMANYLKKFSNIERIDVLPFHKMGEYKWQNLGIKYELSETLPPDAELISLAESILGSTNAKK